MPGIAEGIPGAKAFDEVGEQLNLIETRNRNGGKPPESRIIVERQTPNQFQAQVLNALGIGRNITGEG